ncbi:hypothetical protein SH1V18_05630 [Vallitalea longa]|uniref:Uncharacterized protein n=1 Tax=Vallitalea longa TaxID=2936439 RepID=A0A9W6DE67_9FIRM|nr:hypothetical protein [Vallitalea longa]GKX28083.1 hypothetical protein SH1V18_05630 [Vallitalea longa]
MYACIALLTNDEIQNIGRKMVYDLSVQYGINTISARLPQHISMKQSFKIKDLVEIEGYVEELASDLLEINFD